MGFDRVHEEGTINVDFSFASSVAESDKATAIFVNLHGFNTKRTLGVDKRKELRFDERTRREGLVTKFAEILLRTIMRMSIFVEVRRTTVRTFEHWVSPSCWWVVILFMIQKYYCTVS